MALCKNSQKYKGGQGGFRKHTISEREICIDTSVGNDHGVGGMPWKVDTSYI